MKRYIFAVLFIISLLFFNNEAYADAGVFDDLANRTGKFAEDLRKLAYVISGFGIIMFTYLAICGKINFKHLGYIFISLFFLSGMGALITYAKGGNNALVYKFNDTYVAADTSIGKLNRRNSSL
ncbi:MAG: hypothetical protein NC218_06085 [Acetobacter sp.]|nr:hypothetical protein [Acetobacter sp.]